MTETKGSKVYRAAVIGCGKIGSSFALDSQTDNGVHSHAQAYAKHPSISLVGLSDTDSARLADAGKLWKAETDTNAIALCRRLQPEIISICTPDSTHFETALNLLSETPPKILFIEKPITLRPAEAAQILELARTKNCAIAVNYSRRFSPAFRVLKQELAEGKHGRPVLVRVIYGKGLLHNGSHALDLLRFWLGEPVNCAGYAAAQGLGNDETYTVDLQFVNGCRARLEAFDERIATIFEVDFMTERSRWRFWLGGSKWEFSEVRPSQMYAGYFNYLPTNRENTDALFAHPLANCLWYAVENIAAFLDGDESLICTGEDALAALNLVERIRKSK